MIPADNDFLTELIRLTPPQGWPLGQIILTASDAARYLGVKPGTLRQWVHRGLITRYARDAYDMAAIMNMMVETARRVDQHHDTV